MLLKSKKSTKVGIKVWIRKFTSLIVVKKCPKIKGLRIVRNGKISILGGPCSIHWTKGTNTTFFKAKVV